MSRLWAALRASRRLDHDIGG